MIQADEIVNVNARIIPTTGSGSGSGTSGGETQLVIIQYDPYRYPTLGFYGQGTPLVPFNLGIFATVNYKTI